MKYDSNKIAFYFFMGMEIIAAVMGVGYAIISSFK